MRETFAGTSWIHEHLTFGTSKIQPLNLHFSYFRFILTNDLWFCCFVFTVEAHWNRYVSANTLKTRQVEKLFAIIFRWNVSGRIAYFKSCRTLACMMIAGSWRGHQRSVWKRSAFSYMNIFQTGWISQRSVDEIAWGQFFRISQSMLQAIGFLLFQDLFRLFLPISHVLFFVWTRSLNLSGSSVLSIHSRHFLFPEV